MFTKKNIIIFLILSLLITVSVIFIFKNPENKNANNESILKELKNSYPELNAERLKIYEEIAGKDKKEIFSCFQESNKEECIGSVAFIKNDKNLCYIHDEDRENEEEGDEEESQSKCVQNILRKSAIAETDKCQSLDGDNFFNCLKEIFTIYEKREDCMNLPDAGVKGICEDLFDCDAAYLKYDRGICAAINNEKLRQHCLKNVVDKAQDTDADGLTDLEEINTFKTHHLFSDSDNDGISDGDEIKIHNTDPKNKDTDGDGYSDGDEIKNGYDPKN